VLLVIFGAGASYDSVPHQPASTSPGVPDRLPLANQLFDGRRAFVDAMDLFPECKEIVPFLRKPGIVVESELAKFKRQAEKFPRAHEELAAIRFYLHSALWACQTNWRSIHRGITNYATLLREIERWRYASSESVCIVTFNYDTMLEEAMSQVLRFDFKDVDSYISQRYYTPIKLHGSINWGREVETDEPPHRYNPQRLINEVSSLTISDRYKLVFNSPMVSDGTRVLFPALSIPVERKDEFNCPTSHVYRLTQLLPTVTKVLTIGWRATEADFLGILGENLRKPLSVMVVSGHIEAARETSSNLAPTGLGVTHLFEGGFTDLILDHLEMLEEFLGQIIR
jgi:hypothetical protein